VAPEFSGSVLSFDAWPSVADEAGAFIGLFLSLQAFHLSDTLNTFSTISPCPNAQHNGLQRKCSWLLGVNRVDLEERNYMSNYVSTSVIADKVLSRAWVVASITGNMPIYSAELVQ